MFLQLTRKRNGPLCSNTLSSPVVGHRRVVTANRRPSIDRHQWPDQCTDHLLSLSVPIVNSSDHSRFTDLHHRLPDPLREFDISFGMYNQRPIYELLLKIILTFSNMQYMWSLRQRWVWWLPERWIRWRVIGERGWRWLRSPEKGCPWSGSERYRNYGYGCSITCSLNKHWQVVLRWTSIK